MTVRRGVIGILERDGKLLLVRRAPGVARPGCWCFPGGHIERGENSRVAIQRELKEELDILVDPLDRLRSVRVGMKYVLAVWRVRHLAGRIRPAPAEISECRWATPAQARMLSPGLPSNDEVLAMLKQRHTRGGFAGDAAGRGSPGESDP